MSTSWSTSLIVALDRYTRLPLPKRLRQHIANGDVDAARALRFMPLAGLVCGLCSALAYLLFAQVWPHAIASILAVIVGSLIAGGRGELGVARFFGLVGALRSHQTTRSRATLLPAAQVAGDGDTIPGPTATATAAARTPARPMPTTFAGTLALIFVIVLKLRALDIVDQHWMALVLLTAQPFSNGCAAALLQGGSYAIERGGREPLGAFALFGDRLLALALAIAPAALAAWAFDEPFALAFAGAVSLWFGIAIRRLIRRQWQVLLRQQYARRLQLEAADSGVNTLQQFAEVAYYLGLLAWLTLLDDASPGSDSSDNDDDSDNEEGDPSPD